MYLFVPLAFPFFQLFLWAQELPFLQGQRCANLSKAHKQFEMMFYLNIFLCMCDTQRGPCCLRSGWLDGDQLMI